MNEQQDMRGDGWNQQPPRPNPCGQQVPSSTPGGMGYGRPPVPGHGCQQGYRPQPDYRPYPGEDRPRPQQESNGIGVAGFVLALITVFGGWIPVVGWLTWLLGLVFSAIGVGRKPRGLAIAGLVISLIIPVFVVLLIIVFGISMAGYGLRVNPGWEG